ncbi:conserved hypothetical protein [Vibrio phage 501E54-1]|nr:conserved hypothetical protein [Vibrio phage 501E54-1]
MKELMIINDTKVLSTIWKQDLKRTKDLRTIQILIRAHAAVSVDSLNQDWTYKEFYDKVLNTFEECL